MNIPYTVTSFICYIFFHVIIFSFDVFLINTKQSQSNKIVVTAEMCVNNLDKYFNKIFRRFHETKFSKMCK